MPCFWIYTGFSILDTQKHSYMGTKTPGLKNPLFDILELCKRSILALATLEDLLEDLRPQSSLIVSHANNEVNNHFY